MTDFMDEDGDLYAAFVCTMISAINSLNLYAELSECCRLRKESTECEKICEFGSHGHGGSSR